MAEISDEDETSSSNDSSSSEDISDEEMRAAKKEADMMSMGSANTSQDNKATAKGESFSHGDRPGTGATGSQYGRGISGDFNDSDTLDKIDLEDPKTRLEVLNNENKKHLLGKNESRIGLLDDEDRNRAIRNKALMAGLDSLDGSDKSGSLGDLKQDESSNE